MKWNIGALQFYKKLKKIKDVLCYYFAWKRQPIKCMHLCAGHIFCTLFFFSFLCCSHKKNDLNNAFACHSLGLKIFC